MAIQRAMQIRHARHTAAGDATAASGTAMSMRVPAPGVDTDVERASDRLEALAHADQPQPLSPCAVRPRTPTPSSTTRQREAERAAPHRCTATCRAPLYLTAFCSASWTTRNTQSVRSGDSVGRHVLVRECDIEVRPGSSRLRPSSALTRPIRRKLAPDAGDATGRARCERWTLCALQRRRRQGLWRAAPPAAAAARGRLRAAPPAG